jgi:hypothetical protein
MREILLLAAIVTVNGCAESRTAQRPAGTSRSVPVKLEPPSVSARLRESRQRDSEREVGANTQVQGNVVR